MSSSEDKQGKKSKGFFSKISRVLTKSSKDVVASSKTSNEEISKGYLSPTSIGHSKTSTQSLNYPLPQTQPNLKVSTPTLHQIDSSNESVSKKEAYIPPVQIGFPARSESSVNIHSRGSNGSKKSNGSSKHISTEPKYPADSGKLTKLPAAIGFPTSSSGSNLAGMYRSGSREISTGEDYKKSSLSSLNNNGQQTKVVEDQASRLKEISQTQSSTRSPPVSSNGPIEKSNTPKDDELLPSLPSRAQTESAWPSKDMSGPKRFESARDGTRNHRISNASEMHHNVRTERSGSVASSVKSQRPSKAEAAEEILQKLRATAGPKPGIQQNSQQTMVEKSASMASDVGNRKTSFGTSAGSSFNPSGLKTLAESPSPYILAATRPQFKGPGIDRLATSPKNSDTSLIDNSSPKYSLSGSSDQPNLTVTTSNPAPRSPFATGSSPTGTSHVRTASPFAPKPDSRSGSFSSGPKARAMSRDAPTSGKESSREPSITGRPSFTRNMVSGSNTTDATFSQSQHRISTGQGIGPTSRRMTDDKSYGYRPNPALTILEQTSAANSESNSITGSIKEGNAEDEQNPYAVPGDIHVVQCFPNGDGLFKLIPNWDLESLRSDDGRRGLFRQSTEEMQVESNPRGIPKAPFVENVQKFLSGSSHEQTLQKFQEMIQKYRFMENHLATRHASISQKIPEIQNSLSLVKVVQSGKEIKVDYELVETLYCKAKVKAEKVNLWLGANVMLEYTVEEAIDLLSSKLGSAQTTLEQVKEDLEYIKEQITTMEVNMARVYNDEVQTRREKKVAK